MIKSHKKNIYEILGRDSIHPFPARMSPGIALEILVESGRPLRVLDPMMGSGTVVAVARSQGHRATGVDIDPLAVLLAKVWTTAIDPAEVRNCRC
jgi:tRNA G10  N-methylase Trm11